MSRTSPAFSGSVFINCPFDTDYLPIFEAIVFTVVAADFWPRCALETLDSGTVRLSKIQRLIAGCRYGIHDLSRVELGAATQLPRFNMPFELGLDIAASVFGAKALKSKRFLILDAKPYRYQQFISDISGQDIHSHHGVPDTAIEVTRNWLRSTSGRTAMLGPLAIKRQYSQFVQWLPEYCAQAGFDRKNLLFVEYVAMARQWVAAD